MSKWRDQRGQGTAEYVAIVGLLAAAILTLAAAQPGLAGTISDKVAGAFESLAGRVPQGGGGGPAPGGPAAGFDRSGEAPDASDADGDGLTDYYEESLGTDGASADSDGDGLDDSYEDARGTDPLNPDSDDDEIADGTEVDGGGDPLEVAPSDDYRSWIDPERRAAEHEALYGDADSTERSWEFEDPQSRDGRLRVGFFIQDDETGLPPKKLKGDDRGFDPQFSPNRTRAYLEIDFSNDSARVISNPSCEAGGGCKDAKDIGDGSFGDFDSEVEMEQEDDGKLHFSWELSQSVVPVGPSIDGDLYVEFKDDGSMDISLDHDGYPSVEMYYDDANGTQEVITVEEGSFWDLFGP